MIRMLVMSLALAWVLPLSAGARLTLTGELRDVTGIVVSGDVGITHIDDELWLQMPLSLYGRKLPRRHTITVTPRLVADTDSTDFPEVVIYGGGVIEAVGDIFLEKILAEVDRYCMLSIRPTVELKKAALGDDSVLYGALSMIVDK